MTSTELSQAALMLLRDMEFVPQVVGYDHRISELDAAGMIQWAPGLGYEPSPAGREYLASVPAA